MDWNCRRSDSAAASPAIEFRTASCADADAPAQNTDRAIHRQHGAAKTVKICVLGSSKRGISGFIDELLKIFESHPPGVAGRTALL